MTKRWQIFLAFSLLYMLAYFYRVSLAVVAGDVSQDLQLSPEELGTLSGILFYVYAFAQLPLGPLIDRFGGRLVISACGLLTTAGIGAVAWLGWSMHRAQRAFDDAIRACQTIAAGTPQDVTRNPLVVEAYLGEAEALL